MIEELRATVSGARILSDWLGDGGYPVSKEIAERRSITCLCCPENQQGKWWEKIKNRVARAIREQVEVKNQLKLNVEHEDELGTCLKCKCNIGLKIHVPIEHILEHTSDEVMTAFPDHCWVKNKL